MTEPIQNTIKGANNDGDDAPATEDLLPQIQSNVGQPEEATLQAYKEIGSIEGYVEAIGRDENNKPIMDLITRLDEVKIKCILSDYSFDQISHLEADDAIKGLRIRLYGVIYYESRGILDHIDVEEVEFFPDESELPTMYDLIDPDFTGGLDSVEFIRRKRDDA
jgi:hypothetical protein